MLFPYFCIKNIGCDPSLDCPTVNIINVIFYVQLKAYLESSTSDEIRTLITGCEDGQQHELSQLCWNPAFRQSLLVSCIPLQTADEIRTIITDFEDEQQHELSQICWNPAVRQGLLVSSIPL